MQAIMFDVFGTIVDWRSSLINQFLALEQELGIELPSEALTDQWRQEYAWGFVAEDLVALSEQLTGH